LAVVFFVEITKKLKTTSPEVIVKVKKGVGWCISNEMAADKAKRLRGLC
jgi:hypothetical protein